MSSFIASAEAEFSRTIRARRYREDPALWAWEYLGVQLWSKQREIGQSLLDNRGTMVASAHSTGKTFSEAIFACWWIDTHTTTDTFVATTAPTQDQVRLVWDYIRRFHALSKERFESGVVDHPLPGYITGDNKWKLQSGLTIGQGRKPPDAKVDVAFQGIHRGDGVLAIADEAIGVSGAFLGAIGAITTGEKDRQLLVANPTDVNSAMGQLWSSTSKDPGSMWNRITISALDSPRITADPEFDMSLDGTSGLVGPEYLAQALEMYGSKDDPRYLARVLGQWATDTGMTVFTAEEIARSKGVEVRVPSDTLPELGVDVARKGGDSSQVYTLEVGDVWAPDDDGVMRNTGRTGWKIRYLDSWTGAPLVGEDPENLGTAQRVHRLALEVGAKVIKVDASGIGSAVIDGLMDIGSDAYDVFEVFGGARPEDTRAHLNLRAEQFFAMKKAMSEGVLDIDAGDDELIAELESLEYEYTSISQLKIESKDTIRRKGRKSPDRADAAWYAFLNVGEIMSRGEDEYSMDIEDAWSDFGFDRLGAPM